MTMPTSPAANGNRLASSSITAWKAGLHGCPTCHLIIPLPDRENPRHQHPAGMSAGRDRCPQCGTRIKIRTPDSLHRCWALVLASFILYLPANLLPITVTSALGRPSHSDTIINGVIYFLETGSWHIALIIFIASIVVPLMKLFILTFLMASLHFGWNSRPRERTRLYRLTELVGRWSMVDVYVVTILVALVRFGTFATIEAGPGATYFAALVILTMFAAESFDPRFIWDQVEDDNV